MMDRWRGEGGVASGFLAEVITVDAAATTYQAIGGRSDNAYDDFIVGEGTWDQDVYLSSDCKHLFPPYYSHS